MRRLYRSALLVSLFGCCLVARASAALLSLTVVEGVRGTDGATALGDPILQESLTGTTQAQIGVPPLFDPDGLGILGLTVRITNISEAGIFFPDALPGVSVLTGVYGVPGYSGKTNVAAGGSAGRDGAPGADGALSRTVLDLTAPLDAIAGNASGSHGGGGGAATGVADSWVAASGASGIDLAPYLAGLHLAPGEFVDVPGFVRILAFHRALEGARLGIGFDLPTFSFGGRTITTAAWTGVFLEPGPIAPPSEPPAVPEPGGAAVAGLGLALLGAYRRRSLTHHKGRK